MKSKKAQMQLPLTAADVWSILIWVIVIIIFIALFSIQSCTNIQITEGTVSSARLATDQDFNILNYLRTPLKSLEPLLEQNNLIGQSASQEFNNFYQEHIDDTIADLMYYVSIDWKQNGRYGGGTPFKFMNRLLVASKCDFTIYTELPEGSSVTLTKGTGPGSVIIPLPNPNYSFRIQGKCEIK